MSYSCHPDLQEDKVKHDLTGDGICDCGLRKSYVDVYDLYVSNENYKGNEQVDDFTTWYNGLKQQNVDHVGISDAGDGLFYASATDYTGVVHYFGERTLTVSVSNGADFWFTLKVSKNGAYQQLNDKEVIDIGKTDNMGKVTFTFTPVWGLSSEEVKYEVALATKAELVAIEEAPTPQPSTKTLIGDSKKQADVSAASDKVGVTFTCGSAIGIGEAAAYNVKLSATEERDSVYLADEVTPGRYWLNVTGTSGFITDGAVHFWIAGTNDYGTDAIPLTVAVEGNGAEGHGSLLIDIGENAKQLVIESRNGAIGIRCSLEKLANANISVGKKIALYANPTDAEQKITYQLNVPAGEYVVSYNKPGLYSNSQYKNDDPLIKIGEAEPVAISTLQKATMEFEGNEIIELTFEKESVVYDFMVAELLSLKLDTEESIWLNKQSFPDKSKTYVFTAPEDGYYYVTTKGANYLAISAKSENGSIYHLNDLSHQPDSYNIFQSPLKCEKGKDYYLTFNNTTPKTDSAHPNSPIDWSTPISITAKVSKAPLHDMQLGEQYTETFDVDRMVHIKITAEEEGMYVLNLKMTGEHRIDIFDYDGGSLNEVYGVQNNLLNFTYTSGGIVVPIWMKANESKDYFLYYDKRSSDGTIIQYRPLTYSVEHVTADSGKAVIEDSVTFSDETKYKYYSINSGNVEGATMNITASEEDDVRYIHIWQIIDGGMATPIRTATNQSLSSIQQSVTLEKNKTYHFVVAYLGSTYPQNPVSIQFGQALAKTEISRPYNQYEHLLTWTEVENAEEYELWQSLTGNTSDKYGTYEKVATLKKGDILQYQIPLSNDRFYYVIAKDTDGAYLSSRSDITSSSGVGGHGLDPYGTVTLTINKPADYEGLVMAVVYYRSVQMYNEYGALQVRLEKGQTSQTVEIYTNLNTKYTYVAGITPVQEGYVSYGESFPGIKTQDGTSTGSVSILRAGTIEVTFKLPAHFTGTTSPEQLKAYDTTSKKSYYTSSKLTLPANDSDKETTFTAHIDGVLGVEEGHEYEISFVNNYLPKGNRWEQEKVTVTIDKATYKGTCEMKVLQRAKVKVKIVLPDNFVPGQYSFNGTSYLDAAKSKSQEVGFTVDIPQGAKTFEYEIYAYLNEDAYITLSQSNANSNNTWKSNGYYDGHMEQVATNQEEVVLEYTVKQRAEIVVTIDPVEGHTGESVNITVTAKGSSSISSSTSVALGTEAVTAQLFIVSGYEYTVSGPAFSSSAEYYYDTSVAVTKENDYKGTAKISPHYTYKIEFTIPGASATYGYGVPTVKLFKDGVQTNDYSKDFSNFGKTGYFRIKEYDPDSEYMLVATTLNLKTSTYKQTYFIGSKLVTFEGDSKTTKVELEFAKSNTNYEFTIEDIPQEFVDKEETGNVWLHTYACGVSGDYSTKTSGIVSTTVNFKEAVGGKLTGTLQFVKTDDATFNMTGNMLTELLSKTLATSQNSIKKYYAEQEGDVTLGEDGKYHVTIKIKESLNVGVKFEGLDNSTLTPEFDIKVVVSDKDGKAVGTYSIKVPANASAEDMADAVISLIKWEDGYTAAISSTTTNSAYTVDAEGKLTKDVAGDVAYAYSLAIKVNKRVPVKVTVPALENSTDYVAFDIDLKVNDSEEQQLVSYKLKVPANSQAEDVLYYIYLNEWADNYQAVVSSSTASNAWTIVDAKFSTDEDGKHALTINVTKKPTFKVTIPNLSSELPTDADSFSLTFNVKDGDATKETFKVTVPTNAKADEFSAYIYPKEWQSGWTIEVSGTSNQYLIEGVTVGDALEGGIYPLTVNIKTKEIVKVVFDGLFKNSPVPTFTIDTVVYDSDEKQSIIGNKVISVTENAQDETFVAYMYLNEWSTTLYSTFNRFSGNNIPYRRESTTATFTDVEGKHVMTIHLGKKIVTKVVIPGLEEDWCAMQFNLPVYIRKEGSSSSERTITCTISANQGPDYSYTYIWDADWDESYKYVVNTGTKYGGYIVKDCSMQLDEDGVRVVTVNVEKAQKIRITIPNLDSALKAPQFTLKYAAYNLQHASVGSNNVTVSANQGNDFEVSFFPNSWEEGYTVEVTLSASSSAANYPYIFTEATGKLSQNKDDEHVLDYVVDLKLKAIVKVKVEGIDDENGALSSATYTVNIKTVDGTSIKTLVISLAAGQKDGLLATTFLEAWANGLTAEVTSTATATTEYRIAECTLADVDGEHVLTLQMQKRIAINYHITVPAAYTEKSIQFLNLRINFGDTKIAEMQNIKLAQNATEVSGTFYVDSLEDGYTAVLATTLNDYTVDCKLTVSDDSGVKSGNIEVTVTEKAA